MKVLQGGALSLPHCILTIGNFDGVHLGHRALLNRVLAISNAHKSPSVAMTFRPHPVQILAPQKGLKLLSPLEATVEELSRIGIDYLLVKNFTQEYASQTPEQFIESEVLSLHPREIVVGYDFAFGAGQKGNAQLLAQAGTLSGFTVETVPQVEWEGRPVSSSRIREALSAGDLDSAQQMLGRPYCLYGKVIHGDGRGSRIGIPTANLQIENEMIPKLGVYVTQLECMGKVLPAVTNIGFNPTFTDSRAIKVESHVLASGTWNFYAEPMKVYLLKYLRPEQKFSGPDELLCQIAVDLSEAKRYFKIHD